MSVGSTTGCPAPQRRYGVHRPSTTRSRPARSGVATTSEKPSSASRSTTTCAVPSATSSTSAPFTRSVSSAARAIRSVTPCPTSACSGSQLPHFGLERAEIVGLDVRRVRHDEVALSARQPLGHVVTRERHAVCEPRSLRVFARKRKRVLRDVDRRHRGVRPLVSDRERDRPRARADVEDDRSFSSLDQGEAAFDDDLRFRPRDQRPRVHLQHQPPKPPLTENVGERLAGAAPAHELPAGGGLLIRQRAVELEVDVEAGESERVGDEVFGVDARAWHVFAREEVGRSFDGLRDRHPSRRTRGRRPRTQSAPT